MAQIDPDGEDRIIQALSDEDPLAVILIPIWPPEFGGESLSETRQILRLETGEPGLHDWVAIGLGEIVAKDLDEGPASLLPFMDAYLSCRRPTAIGTVLASI